MDTHKIECFVAVTRIHDDSPIGTVPHYQGIIPLDQLRRLRVGGWDFARDEKPERSLAGAKEPHILDTFSCLRLKLSTSLPAVVSLHREDTHIYPISTKDDICRDHRAIHKGDHALLGVHIDNPG
jgi:hypothetical protein